MSNRNKENNAEHFIAVFSTLDMIEAIGITEYLKQNNVPAFIVNKKDTVQLHITTGEIEVFVNTKDVIKANYLLDKKFNSDN
ncbi:MAG TPA: hypothetical protein DIU39_00555 [Flavobacteriales bacterium]|nr:hypothetical protein [Flavobacteriales bacterium]|tara:strand:+ start:3046 stop:3291 length:246 start_codon:yes stop_codon:yes gene_type:complete